MQKFRSKNSCTCSSNLAYFQQIDIKSFKCAKLARSLKNHKSWGLCFIYGPLCLKIRLVVFCGIFVVLASHKTHFGHFENGCWHFLNVKVENSRCQHCFTWEDEPIYKIWAHYLKNDIDMVMPLVIWTESHECSYKIGHVMRQVFSKVVKIHVYHFSW